MNNIGSVAAGLSLASLGIVCFILTENQFAAGGDINSSARPDGYQASQLIKVGATGMVIMGFGLTILSAIGVNKESSPSPSS